LNDARRAPPNDSAGAPVRAAPFDASDASDGFDAADADVASARLRALAGGSALRLQIEGLHAGYGNTEILHGVSLALGAGQSLCLIGPNGAGKSTVLNAVFGLAKTHRGRITMDGCDVAPMAAAVRLRQAGIAYVLQESSVFPDLSVERNLLLGGYLMRHDVDARRAVERIFERYPRLAQRRRERAGVLSGGERRMLEIARALMLQPRLLLIDEPSIGLEPRATDAVFETLHDLQRRDGTSILLVEQNARQGLAFADLGYVLVAGRLVAAGAGRELLQDRAVARMFLGG
jgi:branched-chain amino acid transport system ATP-binding protein